MPLLFVNKPELYKRFAFAATWHEAESYVLQAALERMNFDFVPYSTEVK